MRQKCVTGTSITLLNPVTVLGTFLFWATRTNVGKEALSAFSHNYSQEGDWRVPYGRGCECVCVCRVPLIFPSEETSRVKHNQSAWWVGWLFVLPLQLVWVWGGEHFLGHEKFPTDRDQHERRVIKPGSRPRAGHWRYWQKGGTDMWK